MAVDSGIPSSPPHTGPSPPPRPPPTTPPCRISAVVFLPASSEGGQLLDTRQSATRRSAAPAAEHATPRTNDDDLGGINIQHSTFNPRSRSGQCSLSWRMAISNRQSAIDRQPDSCGRLTKLLFLAGPPWSISSTSLLRHSQRISRGRGARGRCWWQLHTHTHGVRMSAPCVPTSTRHPQGVCVCVGAWEVRDAAGCGSLPTGNGQQLANGQRPSDEQSRD